jgi:hypothetical protein
MRRIALIAIAAVITGLIAGQVLAGCGSDEPSQPVTTPELTVPRDSSRSADSGTTDEGTTDEGTTGDSGGATPPATETPQTQQTPSGGAQAAPEDTQQNDAPPAAGTPQSKYEQFCEQNPGAC